MILIEAHTLPIGGDPSTAGRALADIVVARKLLDDDLTISLQGLAPGLVISGFFNSFLQRVHECDPSKLRAARWEIVWLHDFPFQEDVIHDVRDNFRPR